MLITAYDDDDGKNEYFYTQMSFVASAHTNLSVNMTYI